MRTNTVIPEELPMENLAVYQLITQKLGVTMKDFAKKVGVKPQAIQRLFKKDSRYNRYPPVTSDMRQRIVTAYNLGADWLDASVERLEAEKGDSVEEEQETEITKGVPVFEQEFACGFLEINDRAIKPTGYAEMPGTGNATCWCKATGHSMEPVIDNGDYICLRRIEGWNDFIVYGDVYAVDTLNDMRTIKKIERGRNDEELSLVPYNRDYPTQPIRKDMIRGLFQVLAVMKNL